MEKRVALGFSLSTAAPCAAYPHWTCTPSNRYRDREPLPMTELPDPRVLLAETFGPSGPSREAALVSAPGRVNLIGEHIDYHGLPVLPIAIRRSVCVAFSARMQAVLPLHDFGGLLQLGFVGGLVRGVAEVLAEQSERIHAQLGGQILQRRTGQERRLRMVRSAPGARAARIHRHRRMVQPYVGDTGEDVGQRRHAAATHAAGRPGD